MLKKIYIHNFRCFQNFEMDLSDLKSGVLIGRNGVGKTSLFDVLEVLQQIGLGVTQIKELIHETDFGFGNKSNPITIEVSAALESQEFKYTLEIEFPSNFTRPKVQREELTVDSIPVLQREGGQTILNNAAHFTLDWHHVGLPLVSVRTEQEPLAVFRRWLSNIIVLSPIPRLSSPTANPESDALDREGLHVLDWAHNLLSDNPSLYNSVSVFLKQRMPDFEVFRFEPIGKGKELLFTFESEKETVILNFQQLSDGEKIYFLAATLLAVLNHDVSILCVWDEPDHFISLPELRHFILSCRKSFENAKNRSQLIMSTHNAHVINEFSEHNTFILARNSHSQPTRVARLADKQFVSPSVIDAYENGELD